MFSAVIVGGGAAGCFCAVELKRRCPQCSITVLEAGDVPMAKLSITGGGRCNITNTFESVSDLREVYPRGARLLKRAFFRFGYGEVAEWWEKQGLNLAVHDGGRVFPADGDAKDVVRTLGKLMSEQGVRLECGCKVNSISSSGNGFVVGTAGGRTYQSRCVIVATGGTSAQRLAQMLPDDIPISPTAPSLFTFRINDPSLKSLMGLSVPQAVVSLCGTAFSADGPVLVTDWGLSGPAVLKLSSLAARYLYERQYRASLVVNWLGWDESEVDGWLDGVSGEYKGRMVRNVCPEGIPERLWQMILARSAIREDCRWAELGSKGRARLVAHLTASLLQIEGRAAFKEEFVTCGGVGADGIKTDTLESRTHKGLFFAGEVLDIDGITGGFNLQAAWTTGYIAAESAACFLQDGGE